MSAPRTWQLVVPLLLVAAVQAEEPAAELPVEGAWVRYHGLHKPEGGPEVVFQTTLKFLGRRDQSGTSCRWVEIVERFSNGPAHAHQYLIPERALRESPHPFLEAVAAYQRVDEGEVQPERLDPISRCSNSTYLMFLPAARKAAKPVDEPRTVEYPHGRLVIPGGHRGEFRSSWEAVTIKQTRTWVSDYTIWLDPKLPAGFAHGHFQTRYERDGVAARRWTCDFFLEDFGVNATSSFAD